MSPICDKNAARRGHLVTLIGEGITVDELAHHFGTIGYEVLTSLGPRYVRVYKGGEAKGTAEPCRGQPARRRRNPRRRRLIPLLLRVEHLLAGLGQLVALLVEAGDDAAAAGHRALAILLIVRLARGLLLGGQRLRSGCA